MRDNREDLTLSAGIVGIVYLSVQGSCYCASAAVAPEELAALSGCWVIAYL